MEPHDTSETTADQQEGTAPPVLTPHSDFDSPWKEAIEQYFQDFLAFFFPVMHAGIDWSKGYEFLDKELERVVHDAMVGRRYADKLVKVFLPDGHETWLLIHIEVQGYPDTGFRQRMFVYHYRIFDRYGVEVVSLAVCTDEVPAAHTAPYQTARWGCELTFTFPVIRVQDFASQWTTLEQQRNPFAVVVMAHVKARETRQGQERKEWKLRLMRGLYERGYGREDIMALFRFIDWLLVLPAALEQEFWQELRQFEEATQMPYVTSVERRGFEQGHHQGLEEGKLQEAREALLEVVAAQFGAIPEDVRDAVQRLETREALHTLLRHAVRCTTLEMLRSHLPTVQP